MLLNRGLYLLFFALIISLFGKAQTQTDDSKYLIGFDEKRFIEFAKAEGIKEQDIPVLLKRAESNYIKERKDYFKSLENKNKPNQKVDYVHSVSNASCQNLDFEDGNYANWLGQTYEKLDLATWPTAVITWVPGIVTGGPNFNIYSTSSVHSLMTIPPGNNDYTLGKLVGWDSLAIPLNKTKSEVEFVPSGSGTNTLRLGNATIPANSGNGAFIQKVSYNMNISNINSLFTYRYAIFLNEPDPQNAHAPAEQPFFSMIIRKQNGDTIKNGTNTCGYYRVDASNVSSDPTFIKSRWKVGNDNIYYRKWRTESVDLSPYVGQQLSIEFTTAHCSRSGHFGYAYIDADCGSLQLTQQNICINNSAINLIAPPGYHNYQWQGPNNSTNIPPPNGTNDTLYITNPKVGDEYTVSMYNASNCLTTAIIKVDAATIKMGLSTTPSCNSGKTGAASVTSIGSAPFPSGYNYKWTTGPNNTGTVVGTTQTASGLGAGTYYVRITSPNCPDKDTFVVVKELPPVLSRDTVAFCKTTGIIPAITTGSGYQWYNNSNVLIPAPTGINDTLFTSPVAHGEIYTVTYLNATGCKDSVQKFMKLVDANFKDSVIKTCFAGATGSIILNTLTPQYSPYSYTWTGSSSGASVKDTANPTIHGLADGTYTINVTSTTKPSCKFTQTITVKSNPVPVHNKPGIFCLTKATLVADLGGSNYQWYDNNNAAIPAGTGITGGKNDTLEFNTAATGQIYSVSFIDKFGCKDSIRFTLQGFTSAGFLPTTTPTCYPGKTGVITLTDQSSGLAPYTYSWSGTSSGSVTTPTPLANPTIINIPSLGQGSYTVIVKSTVNTTCEFTATIPINYKAVPYKLDSVFYCKKTAIVATTSTGSAYQWYYSTPIKPIPDPSATTSTLTWPNAVNNDIYTVTYIDAAGCKDSIAYKVKLRDSKFKDTTYNACAGGATGSIKLTDILSPSFPYGPFNYSWTGPSPGSVTTSTASPIIIPSLIKGVYTVTINSVATPTCTYSVQVTVKENPVTYHSDSTTFCKGIGIIPGPIAPIGQPAYTNYQWYDNSHVLIPSPIGTNDTLYKSPVVNGQIYSLTYMKNGCRDSINYKVKLLDANFADSVIKTCFGGTTGYIKLINLVPVYKPFDYTWTGPTNGTSGTNPLNNPIISPLSAGVYTVNVVSTVKPSCTFTKTFTILSNPAPALKEDTVIVCPGATYNLTPGAPLSAYPTHSWYSQKIQPPGSPLVSLNVTSNTLLVSPPPTSGGNGLNVEGVYYIDSVRTVDGCKYAYKTHIKHNYFTLSTTSPVIVNEPCYHDSVGSVAATVQSAYAPTGQPYVYTWTGPFPSGQPNPLIHTMGSGTPNSDMINHLHPGTYTLTISSNGCSKTITATVTEPPKPAPILHMEAWFCKRDTIGFIVAPPGYSVYTWYKIKPNGDTAFFAYSGTNDTLIIVDPEVSYNYYFVTYMYSNGCRMTTNAFVLQTPSPKFYPEMQVNIFTPNNDGRNDKFMPFYDPNHSQKDINYYADEFNIKIYDRWGTQVFESNNYLKGWDGKKDGKELEDGNYYWISTYKPQCGNSGDVVSKQGFVQLVH